MGHRIQETIEALRTRLQAARSEGRRRRGMTLIEVMIVIAIIVLLMGALTVGLQQTFSDSQRGTAEMTIRKIESNIGVYRIKKRKLPSAGEGLKAVYTVEPVPVDPWGNEYIYRVPGPEGRDFDIISLGADGREGGEGSDADIKLSDLD